jgi:fructose transport system ATP-binding protein
MSDVQPILKARGLLKRYGHVVALNGADFDLYPGEILAVIGDNGAGKSTLIKAISGAIIPDHGEIELEGAPVAFRSPQDARNAGIETVYQNLALSPALSIADNMFLGRELRKPGALGSVFRLMDRTKMQRLARDKLNELGLMTSRTSTSRSRRSRAVSGKVLPWRGRRHSAPRSSSWTSRRPPWASRSRAGCSS